MASAETVVDTIVAGEIVLDDGAVRCDEQCTVPDIVSERVVPDNGLARGSDIESSALVAGVTDTSVLLVENTPVSADLLRVRNLLLSADFRVVV